MLKITRWRPDTCDCELEYEWDDSQNEDVRTHSVKNILKACPVHSSIATKGQHYATVLDENQRKNKVLGEILEKLPALVEEVTQEDGTTVKKLRKGLEYKWSFDVDRNLEVDLVGAKLTEKSAVKVLTDVLFPGKVKIK